MLKFSNIFQASATWLHLSIFYFDPFFWAKIPFIDPVLNFLPYLFTKQGPSSTGQFIGFLHAKPSELPTWKIRGSIMDRRICLNNYENLKVNDLMSVLDYFNFQSICSVKLKITAPSCIQIELQAHKLPILIRNIQHMDFEL